MGVNEKLTEIQHELKAPKNQYNKFGGFYYRSCEDILEGLKPVLLKKKASLVLSDSIELIGDRYYVKATAKFTDTETGEFIENFAYARESVDKKGMDDSQITGATSSYARKYALNGLFLIDDTKDADTDEYQNQQKNAKSSTKTENKNTTSKKQEEPSKEVKEMLTDEAIANVDKNLIPNGGKVSQAQLKMLHAELERTGINPKTVLAMFKVEKFEDMSDAQGIACLNKFKNTPDKKA